MKVSLSSPLFQLISILLLLAISLPAPTTTIRAETYDFIASANLASWSSAAGSLSFPGSESDERGFALWKDNVKLEDGSQPTRILETHPQWVTDGWIAGVYPAFTVPANATLELKVGFIEGATGSDGVIFRVEAKTDAQKGFSLVKEQFASYDKKLDTLSVPLTEWAGKSTTFRLMVKAGKGAGQDWAGWVTARINALPTPAAITITSTCPLVSGDVNQGYGATLSASGGQPPYNWIVKSGSLPSGLTLDLTKGVIAGTPTQAGKFTFSLQVFDGTQAFSPVQDCEITVREGPVPATPVPFDLSFSVSPRDVTLNLDPLLDGSATQVETSFTLQVTRTAGAPRPIALAFTDLPGLVNGYCSPGEGLPPFSAVCTLYAVTGSRLPENGTSPVVIWATIGSEYLRNTYVNLTITQTLRGDLIMTALDPVQVLYSTSDPLAPIPLIKGKATLFRAKVFSTFPEAQTAFIRLSLPESQWDTAPISTGRVIPGVPASYTYPSDFGPYTLLPGENIVIIPLVEPGQETAVWDAASHPAGIINGQCVGSICGPDVRVVPRPNTIGMVNFSAEVDSHGAIGEINETNNSMTGTNEVKGSRPWRFYFVPFKSNDGNCYPDLNFATAGAKGMLEYALATFPIADGEIEYAIAPFTTVTACASGTGTLCGYNTVWENRNDSYAGYEDRGQFLQRIARLARSEGYDVAVGLGCGGGGGTGGSNSAFFIGDCSGLPCDIFAHEFMHLTSGMGDIYSLDCLVGWDESYCEHPDGSRTYCCYIDEGKHDGTLGPICSQDVGATTRCTPNYEKDCTVSCNCSIYAERADDYAACTTAPVCNEGCCRTNCLATCDGTVFGGPDGRIYHPTTEGFWVNRYIPTGVKTYFMDTATLPGWTFPARWMRSLNTASHCSGDVFNDGYINLVYNPRFLDTVDPEVLLVSGVVHKDGTVQLDPFLHLSDQTLDGDISGKGAYAVELVDSSGKSLTKVGFTPVFYQSDPNGGEIDSYGFSFRMEWSDAVKSIRVVDEKGSTLAQRDVSANEPGVTVSSPNGGEKVALTQPLKIKWKGNDPDGDPLTYFVSLSADEGETWVPIATDVSDTSMELPILGLAVKDGYLVRVRVSDGVLTGEDTSDTAFQIVGTPGEAAAPTQVPIPGLSGNTLKTILLAISIGGGLLILIVILAVILGRKKKA